MKIIRQTPDPLPFRYQLQYWSRFDNEWLIEFQCRDRELAIAYYELYVLNNPGERYRLVDLEAGE